MYIGCIARFYSARQPMAQGHFSSRASSSALARIMLR